MTQPFQLQFATYTFPNKSFELADHRLDIDSPVQDVRRKDGGDVQEGFLRPKRWRINGKIYGEDSGSVDNALNTMKRAMHNNGAGASFYYRSGRYAFAQLAPGGMRAVPVKGLYEYLWEIDILMVSEPFVESDTVSQAAGSRTNNSAIESITMGGNYPGCPIIQFIAGTWDFGGTIRVENTANSHFFEYSGGLLAGQTLVIDACGGCVLLHVGMTMVDAISLFGGNLRFLLEPGGQNDLMINAPTLDYTIDYRNRWYI